MNTLSKPKHPRSQSSWSNMPWGTFLFLLVIFVYSTPLWFFNWGLGTATSLVDSAGVSDVLGQDNWMRIIALIALGAFALFNLLRSKPGRLQINGLLGWLILFYLVWVVLSIIWSLDPRFTLKRVGILILLSLGALYVAERLSLQETIALVLFICAVSVLLGLVLALGTNDFYPFTGWWRFGGNMHPIAQGWHCGLLLLSALALQKAKQNHVVYIGIIIIAFIFLLLTRSRMAFISCIMASALYWSMTTPKRHQSVLLFLGIIIGGSLIYLLLGNLLFIQFGEKAITLGRGELGLQSMQSLTGRRPLWNALNELINQRPFAGYGYDSFLIGQNLHWVTEKLDWAVPQTHSGYISTLGGLGYIGFITLVLILILSVTMSINLFRQNRDYAFIVAVLVWLIFNLFTEDQLLTRPYLPVFIWMIILAKLGFVRQKR